jgi:DNA-binding NarL/FixJ family response regulator
VDDLQWIDPASSAILAFLARRLSPNRVGLLATCRSDHGSHSEHILPRLDIRPLRSATAAWLLRAHYPSIGGRTAQRVVQETRGNPLALLELSGELVRRGWASRPDLPSPLPLPRSLRGVFGPRVEGLPVRTRRLLLTLALDGTGELGVALRAVPDSVTLADLAPAEQAGLVSTDDSRHLVVFRHPLVAPTVVQLASISDRKQTHHALAGALADQPERRLRHRADAAVHPDERLAELLEEAAYRGSRRGDPVGAVGALLKAARLSDRGTDRARRFAEAAYLGADVTGDLRSATGLLTEARRAQRDLTRSLEASTAAAYALLNGDGDVDTAHRVLVDVIERQPRSGIAGHGLVEALHTLMLVCHFSGRRSPWEPFHRAFAQLGANAPDTLDLCVSTYVHPVTASAAALSRLDAAVADLSSEVDPSRIVRVGIAAFFVDRLGGCREALWRTVHSGRAGGAVASAVNSLMLRAFDDLLAGRWDHAEALAQEGVDLCRIHDYRLLAWPGWYARALVSAARGDDRTTGTLTREMRSWADPRGVRMVQMYARHADALAALGRGDADAAYRELAAISPAGTLPPHLPLSLWVTMDLVEAAQRTGRRAEAAAHVAEVEAAGVDRLSPRLALLAHGAAGIVAADQHAEHHFERALSVSGAQRWPFELSRVRLAYGERLRRSRAISRARQQLQPALEGFQRLGADPWCARAQAELSACGHPRTALAAGPVVLTARERAIATLAASGLSNKEIARRLQLSPRTVGTHLYRLFPKLGVTSRAALRDALAADPARAGEH